MLKYYKKNSSYFITFCTVIFDGILVPFIAVSDQPIFGRLVLLLPVKGQVRVRLDLDEVGYFRRLKIGRRSRERERKEAQIEVIYQPPNYKIKFTLNKI